MTVFKIPTVVIENLFLFSKFSKDCVMHSDTERNRETYPVLGDASKGQCILYAFLTLREVLAVLFFEEFNTFLK